MTDFDKELIDNMYDDINNKSVIVIQKTDVYFDFISDNFPISANRIDWDKVDNSIDLHIEELDINDTVKLFNSLSIFFEEVAKRYNINSDEKIIIIGDNLTEYGYEMKFSLLKQRILYFLQIPQHTYCIFPISKYCLNITFENSFHFGKVTHHNS
jgi:hypothetical protein